MGGLPCSSITIPANNPNAAPMTAARISSAPDPLIAGANKSGPEKNPIMINGAVHRTFRQKETSDTRNNAVQKLKKVSSGKPAIKIAINPEASAAQIFTNVKPFRCSQFSGAGVECHILLSSIGFSLATHRQQSPRLSECSSPQ